MHLRILIAIAVELGCGGRQRQRCDPPSKVTTGPQEVPRPPLALGGLTLGQHVDAARTACVSQGGEWTSDRGRVVKGRAQPAGATIERFEREGWDTLCVGSQHGVVAIRSDFFGRVHGIRAGIATPVSGRFAYVRQKLVEYEAVLGKSSTPGDLAYCTEHDLCGQPPYDDPKETWGEFTLRAVITEGEMDLELVHHDSALVTRTVIGDAACRPR